MQKAEADKQITQMVGFIKKEATERALDIKKETDSEANARKLDRERVMKLQLKDEFTRKKKEKQVQQRIERSKKKNDSRVEQMRERDKIMKKLKEEVAQELAAVSKNNKYPDLIRYLIAQGLMIITENKVEVQCRKEDETIVKNELKSAVKLYTDFIKDATGVLPKVTVHLSNDWLPPAPVKGVKGVSCSGGVVLSSRNGTIICKNTLDSRLDLCFDNLIPQIRGLMFGERAKIANVESEIERMSNEHHSKLLKANAVLAGASAAAAGTGAAAAAGAGAGAAAASAAAAAAGSAGAAAAGGKK